MNDFKSFLKNKNMQKNSDKPNDFENIKQKNPQQYEEIADNLKKFQNMSQGELMSELLRKANEMKQDGSLNPASLNILKDTLLPILNEEQKKLFQNILEQIK